MQNARLKVERITKSFAGTKAVNDISFDVFPGEVHAVVGENGAGKSTLMKMIIGELKPDSGKIYYDGKLLKSNADRLDKVSMIHQELAALPDMTIMQNLFLGREIRKGPFLDDAWMYKKTNEIMHEYGIPFDGKTLVNRLNVAQVQMLEIIKAIYRESKLIIMDEPTSSLSVEESNKLFSIIRELKSKNISVIYISHRLEEVIDLSDRITVLRDGCHIETLNKKEVKKNKLIELMVGRPLNQIYPKEKVALGNVCFEVKNLTYKNVFRDTSFSVRKGEIVGLSGLVGAGRSDIANAIFGLIPKDSGQLILDGKELKIKTPYDAIQNGIALVTEERKDNGLVLCLSVRENALLANYKKIFPGPFISSKKEKNVVSQLKDRLSIKCNNIETKVDTLSGGNQQKVVLAKWLISNPKVLIMDEPTRGIDVGAKYAIYQLITELAKLGISIILISSELPELIGMSDRVLVVSKGRLVNEFTYDEIMSGKVTQSDLLCSALQEL